MKKILAFLDKYFEEIILCILLLLITVCMLGDVLSRFFLGKSIKWAIEFGQYCFVYTTFIAVPYCVRKGSNLKIDVIISFLPEKTQKAFSLISEVICLGVWSLFFYYAWPVLTESIRHVQYSTTMNIPLYWLYGIPFAAFFLAVIREIQAVILLILQMKKDSCEERRKGQGEK